MVFVFELSYLLGVSFRNRLSHCLIFQILQEPVFPVLQSLDMLSEFLHLVLVKLFLRYEFAFVFVGFVDIVILQVDYFGLL